MSQPDYSQFALSEAQRAAIYKSVIQPQYFERSTAGLELPIAIITGGQPGSGKSVLREAAEQVFAGQGGAVVSDPDELRRYHPRYTEFNALDDKTTASKVQADASAWSRQLMTDAIAERRNLILDRTLGSASQLSQMSEALLKAGYEVRIDAMAVRPEVSTVRIHFRYETERAQYGHGRFTPLEFHDKAYAGLVGAVQRAQDLDLASNIRLYDANTKPIYQNERTGGAGWSHMERAVDVLKFERARPLSLQEWTALSEQANTVLQMRTDRNASPAEVAEAKALTKTAQQIGMSLGFKLGESPTPTPYAAGKFSALSVPTVTPVVKLGPAKVKGL